MTYKEMEEAVKWVWKENLQWSKELNKPSEKNDFLCSNIFETFKKIKIQKGEK